MRRHELGTRDLEPGLDLTAKARQHVVTLAGGGAEHADIARLETGALERQLPRVNRHLVVLDPGLLLVVDRVMTREDAVGFEDPAFELARFVVNVAEHGFDALVVDGLAREVRPCLGNVGCVHALARFLR